MACRDPLPAEPEPPAGGDLAIPCSSRVLAQPCTQPEGYIQSYYLEQQRSLTAPVCLTLMEEGGTQWPPPALGQRIAPFLFV